MNLQGCSGKRNDDSTICVANRWSKKCESEIDFSCFYILHRAAIQAIHDVELEGRLQVGVIFRVVVILGTETFIIVTGIVSSSLFCRTCVELPKKTDCAF